MPVKFHLSIIAGLLLSIMTLAQNKTPIAILDLEASGISNAEAVSLTNRIRHELFQTGIYRVMERAAMEEVLNEQGFQLTGCTSSECAVQAGRILGVNTMMAGSVDKAGRLYSIYLRMIDVETGEILKTASADCECPIEEVVVKTTKEVVAELVGEQQVVVDRTTAIEPRKERGIDGRIINRYSPDRAMTLPEKSFLIRLLYFDENVDREYNWSSHQWEFRGEHHREFGCKTKISYGISDKLEATIQLLSMTQRDNIYGNYNSGQGDFIVSTRYAVLPWSVDKSGISLAGGIRMGNNDGRFTDKSTDYLFGGLYSTKWLGNVRINLDLQYWINGKGYDAALKADGVHIGNANSIFPSLDLKLLNKFMISSGLKYYIKGVNEDSNGDISNSEIRRLSYIFDITFAASQRLYFKSGFCAPSWTNLDKGGYMSTGKLIIDLWYLL